jgi:hypothetical protein
MVARGVPPRRAPSEAMIACEQKLIHLRPDGEAAREGLPGVAAVVQSAVEEVSLIGLALEDATYRVALEALEDFCADRLLPAINSMLQLQAIAEGLEATLWMYGRRHGGSSTALSAAGRAGEIIAAAKSAAGVPHNTEAGERLIAALATDPMAEIE